MYDRYCVDIECIVNCTPYKRRLPLSFFVTERERERERERDPLCP